MAGMVKRADFLENEVVDLTEEIKLVSPTDTPLTTLLMGRGQVVPANDITVTWREKELNSDRGRAGTHIITHDIKSTVNKSSDLNVAQALSTGGSSGAITMDIAVKDEVESPHYEGVGVGMAFTKIITHDINSKATNSGNTTVASPVNTATVITIN